MTTPPIAHQPNSPPTQPARTNGVCLTAWAHGKLERHNSHEVEIWQLVKFGKSGAECSRFTHCQFCYKL